MAPCLDSLAAVRVQPAPVVTAPGGMLVCRVRVLLAVSLVAGISTACAGAERAAGSEGPARRIVSLDYCADQYVLGLADRSRILALSPDAAESFSYLRAAAAGMPTIRPRAEEVLALRPDLVVRSYGGGPRIRALLERAGVSVLEIPYAPDIAAVRATVRHAAAGLGVPARGEVLIADMDARLERARESSARTAALYLTPAGVSAGSGTFVHHLIEAAGLGNFDDRSGWRSIPLERLAYESPDVYAVAAFGATNHEDAWTAFRHPVATGRVAAGPTLRIEGAMTACSGWFLADAVEAFAAAPAVAAADAAGELPARRP